MKRFSLLFLLGLSLPVLAFGQDRRALTLRQSIERAQAGSPASQVARLDFAQSQWGYRAFRAQYLPALALTGSAPDVQRSISDVLQDDGTVRYVERNQTQGQASLALTQLLPMTGGQVTVSSGLSRLDNEFDGQNFVQWSSAPLVVRLTQPLFQFNDMKWTRRTEPLRYQRAERAYVEDLEQIAVDITNRFFDVYIAQMNVDISAFNVAVNDTIFQLSQGRFDIGKIAENDLLQSELALLNAQSERASAEIAYQEALQDLKRTLDLPYDTDLEVVPPTTIPVVQVDQDEAVAQALRNRPVFLDQEITLVEAERELARARRANGFSANLSASYGLNQTARAFDGAYLDPRSQQRFNVTFQVPLYQWGRGRADVEAALAAQERALQNTTLERKEREQEVYFEVLQLDLLQQQVRVAAKADTVAARRFEVAKNRYLIGKIDITELFNAQREKDGARRGYIQTLRQFWTTYFNVRRLTLYDFARRQPLTQPFN